jgi:hypothetical protein
MHLSERTIWEVVNAIGDIWAITVAAYFIFSLVVGFTERSQNRAGKAIHNFAFMAAFLAHSLCFLLPIIILFSPFYAIRWVCRGAYRVVAGGLTKSN